MSPSAAWRSWPALNSRRTATSFRPRAIRSRSSAWPGIASAGPGVRPSFGYSRAARRETGGRSYRGGQAVRVLPSLRKEHLVSGTSWRLLVVVGPSWAVPSGSGATGAPTPTPASVDLGSPGGLRVSRHLSSARPASSGEEARNRPVSGSAGSRAAGAVRLNSAAGRPFSSAMSRPAGRPALATRAPGQRQPHR